MDIRHWSFRAALGAAALLFSACTRPVEYPAREATVIGGVRLLPPDAEAGRDRATGFVQPGDGLDFTVFAPEAGFYFLDLTYACTAAKRIPVLVNGRMQGSRLFPQTDGFKTHRYGRVVLAAGANTVRIDTDWGYADIHALRVSRAPRPDGFRLRSAPVNPSASPEARALFSTLTREFGRRTFAGQHEANPASPSRLAQVARLADGAQPALLGLDLIFCSPAWNRPEGDATLGYARDWVREKNGLVTLSWHWLAPLYPGPLVWDSFSTNKTAFDVARLADESSSEYAAVIRDLDHIAGKLKVLRDAGIPVLWRPLHEAEGGWFWWGARGPEATKRLYRLMFDRFTRVHRLDNLLWVWTSTDDDGAADWYPGNDYVDVVAADLYFPPGTRGDFFTVFDGLRERYRGRKPVALGECGALPDLTPDAPWLWFLAWDDFIARPDINPASLTAEVYRHPRTITLRHPASLLSLPR